MLSWLDNSPKAPVPPPIRGCIVFLFYPSPRILYVQLHLSGISLYYCCWTCPFFSLFRVFYVRLGFWVLYVSSLQCNLTSNMFHMCTISSAWNLWLILTLDSSPSMCPRWIFHPRHLSKSKETKGEKNKSILRTIRPVLDVVWWYALW